ncbi:hypothetical protein [Streptomyces sp. NPDC059009]|uniref:hypothetical protein n=1 Tax=Streptomyces sp. NPDC059009 TaxID=3346694 RepID=UPI0036CF8C86
MPVPKWLPFAATRLDAIEATLVEQYARLVRLAYVVLPRRLGRHSRVLGAHAVVQQALPHTPLHLLPGQRHDPDTPHEAHDAHDAHETHQAHGAEYFLVRERVLRRALRHAHRPHGWPRFLPPPRMLRPTLPMVWGLRLFPHLGGTAEAELDQALHAVSPPARAAFALRHLDGLGDADIDAVLTAVGVPDASRFRAEARTLEESFGAPAEPLVLSDEFDPCAVQAGPTDLLRRRNRRLAGFLTALVLVAAAGVTAVHFADDSTPTSPLSLPLPLSGAETSQRTLNPRNLERVADDEWLHTARIDFSAWPARGELADDHTVLARALAAWSARPTRDLRRTATPGTPTEPPSRPPQLLFAGKVDGRAIVVLHDGMRLVRYGEPAGIEDGNADGTGNGTGADDAGAAFTIDFARTDESDVTTAGAVEVSRSRTGGRSGGGGEAGNRGKESARFLLAPWIAESATRDLLRPNTPARGLPVSGTGITDRAPVPTRQGSCTSWPVLQLRSSSKVAEKHAFLLSDLGGPAPAHLTYTPLPSSSVPARQPREATGTPALLAWAHIACGLQQAYGGGIRAVNTWDYAEQRLPEHGGRAVWSCVRYDSWRGPGDVTVRFRDTTQAPDAPAADVARVRKTHACSRFGLHVLASRTWTAPSGHRYLLAAGSRAVTSIRSPDTPSIRTSKTTLAVRAPSHPVRLSARLRTGDTVAGLTDRR